ncbi:SpoIIE family protein phosphatase [Halioglobus sp.]|nr:SpoIIE family protein phosphatase [Halioglobus sp.]
MSVSKGNLLIIDDEGARARVLADRLSVHGFDSQIVTDVANTAYSLGWDSDVDVILCELELKNFSWESARLALRTMDVQVPVIMLCGTAEVEPMMNALRLGAADFFLRPVDERALIKSLQRCVRQRRLRRELQESRESLEAANRELRGTVKMLEQDQQAGRQVQLRMLPNSPLALNDYVFSHTVVPSLYLSGDFTDYFTLGDHHVIFFMADVSGHGSSSAFATVLLKNLFARKRSDFSRRGDQTIMDLAAMLSYANQELLDLQVDKFATMLVGLLDIRNNSLSYSVAGHLPLPVLVSDDGARYLEGGGSPVGLLADAQYQVDEIVLPERFTLALFSDGILEILPPKNLIDKEEYLLQALARGADAPEDVVERLGLNAIATAPDDIAALFLSRQV